MHRGQGMAGRHAFKHNDFARAIRAAKAAGMSVDAVEVVTKDGVLIRVLGTPGRAKPEVTEFDRWASRHADKA
jgi:hypothetical protein